jgi:transcriptional regulator with XRE-family HTH domain
MVLTALAANATQPVLAGPRTNKVDWVRHRARQLDLSQTELAERAGMTRAYLHRLCAGGVPNPGVLTLQRLAQALQLPTAAMVRLWLDAGCSNDQACAHGQQARYVSPHDPRDVLVFMGDVTVPAHSVVLPGERFTKTWAVQNVGQLPWSARRLVRKDAALVVSVREHNGHLTAAPDARLKSLGDVVEIPPTPPGAVLEFSTDFAAPRENCSAVSVWRIESLTGEPSYKCDCLFQVVVTVLGD